MRFCDLPKLPLICHTFRPDTEERHDAEVKVVTLVLTLDPLTPAIAAAIDPTMRRLLFKTTDTEPAELLEDVTLALTLPRQLLTVFSTPDSTKAAFALDQVEIGQVRAKLGAKGRRWTLQVKLTYGPCSGADLACIQEWYATQRFVTFTPAEAQFDFDAAAGSAARDVH